MIPIETTSCPSVPATSGTMPSRPWTCCRSELARETTCPVRSASCFGPVEARDRAEHAAAQVVLDPERQAPPEVAAQEGGAEADDGDGGHRDHQRAEPRGGPGDGAVDRRGDQQRPDGLEADAQHRGREGGHGERGAAPAVARETSHPAAGAAGRHVLTRGDALGGALRGALRRSGGGREVSSQIRTAPRQAARSRTRRRDERPASWSNTPVRHFLLGPLWESRRAHVFDERCRRA